MNSRMLAFRFSTALVRQVRSSLALSRSKHRRCGKLVRKSHSLVLLIALLSGPSIVQATDYWWNPTTQMTDVSKQSLCDRIAQKTLENAQRVWENDYPDAGISTTLTGTWIVDGLPSGCFVTIHVVRTYPDPFGSSEHDIYSDGGGIGQPMHRVSLEHYSSGKPLSSAEPTNCCNPVHDPINPATGSVFKIEEEFPRQGDAESLSFGRFYSSTNTDIAGLGPAWRHSYSRRVRSVHQAGVLRPYVAGDPDNSSLYSDPSSACVNGFAQIQSRVSNWVGATASYDNNLCKLIKGGRVIAVLPSFYRAVMDDIFPMTTIPVLPIELPTPIGYDVTRDDGQVIRFTVQGGVITPPPTIKLRLQLAAGGYKLTDVNDSVESYSANGTLLSITSRAGVVQTMSYDTTGRLSAVTDSFGHSLTLSYDTQNRLISVTRQ